MSGLFEDSAADWVGRVFTAAPYPVTALDIAKFAIALGVRDPIHFDRDAARRLGHPDVVAPLGYYVVVRLSRPHLIDIERLAADGTSDYDIPPSRTTTRMAGETLVEFRRSMIAGDEITLRQEITGIDEKRGRSGPLAVVRYEFSYLDASEDEVVHETYSRLLR